MELTSSYKFLLGDDQITILFLACTAGDLKPKVWVVNWLFINNQA